MSLVNYGGEAGAEWQRATPLRELSRLPESVVDSVRTYRSPGYQEVVATTYELFEDAKTEVADLRERGMDIVAPSYGLAQTVRWPHELEVWTTAPYVEDAVPLLEIDELTTEQTRSLVQNVRAGMGNLVTRVASQEPLMPDIQDPRQSVVTDASVVVVDVEPDVIYEISPYRSAREVGAVVGLQNSLVTALLKGDVDIVGQVEDEFVLWRGQTLDLIAVQADGVADPEATDAVLQEYLDVREYVDPLLTQFFADWLPEE